MSFENIIFEEVGNIAVIKFNRPKALNAINPDVLAEVGEALEQNRGRRGRQGSGADR